MKCGNNIIYGAENQETVSQEQLEYAAKYK